MARIVLPRIVMARIVMARIVVARETAGGARRENPRDNPPMHAWFQSLWLGRAAPTGLAWAAVKLMLRCTAISP